MREEHHCQAAVVTCIDFRFQKYIDGWIRENLGEGNHDRIALAGGVKDLETIVGQLKISHRLHDIKKIILMNHEDCGAYGADGTAKRHAGNLAEAKSEAQKISPDLEVNTYYLLLDGTFVQI